MSRPCTQVITGAVFPESSRVWVSVSGFMGTPHHILAFQERMTHPLNFFGQVSRDPCAWYILRQTRGTSRFVFHRPCIRAQDD